MINALETSSTRPYLIRALYEWCTDNGFTPYVAVSVDDTVVVPREYVRDGEIVLNISFDATSSLKLGNEAIEFKARFAGVAREINVPISRVLAVYARENGQGMAFPMGSAEGTAPMAKGSSKGLEKESGKPPALISVSDVARTSNVEAKIVPLGSAQQSRVHEETDPVPPRPPAGGRPSLKRIK